jgi:hypothetical protein
MGIQQEQHVIPHWNYFIALEEDITNLARYIEFSELNYKCYSMELARILFSASSEIDVIAKQYCRLINKGSKASNINQYKTEIMNRCPTFSTIKVGMPKFALTLEPWSNWEGKDKGHPVWWRAYNNVKHERNEYFSEANLQNALNSVAALFVLLIFFYRKEAENGALSPNQKLFVAKEPFVLDFLFYGQERNYVYNFSNVG